MLDQFGNFGGKTTFSPNFSGWTQQQEEEDEKKRRQQQLIYAQQLRAESADSLSSQPHQVFKAMSDEAEERQAAKDATGITGPMQEYQHLSRMAGGSDKMDARVRDVYRMWKTYMSPWPGSGAVWDLVRSPYDLKQIETMLAVAHKPMFDGTNAPADTIAALGLDPDNQQHAKIAGVLHANTALGNTAIVTPLIASGLVEKITDGLRSIWNSLGNAELAPHNLARTFMEWGKQPAATSSINPLNVAKGLVDVAYDNIPARNLSYDEYVRVAANPTHRVDNKLTRAAYDAALASGSSVRILSEKSQFLGEVGLQALLAAETAGVGSLVASQYAGAAKALQIGKYGQLSKGMATGVNALTRAAPAMTALPVVMNAMGQAGEEEAANQILRDQALADKFAGDPLDRFKLYEWEETKDEFGNVNPVLTSAMDRINAGVDYAEYLGSAVWGAGTELTPKETLTEIMKACQETVYDEDGNVLVWGKGEGLQADGILTDKWREAIRDTLEDVERNKLDRARFMLENKYVAAWAPLDNLEHPEWKAGEQRLQAKQEYWQRAYASNPVLSAAKQMSGLPLWEPYAWSTFFNGLFENGVLQGIYKSPIVAATAAGNGYNAALASFGAWARLQNDPQYQQWKQQLAGVGAESGQGLMTQEDIEGAYLEGKLPEAGTLIHNIKAREAETVASRFSPAVILDFQHLFGLRDADAIENWGKENLDVVHAGQFVFDVASGLMTPLKGKAKPLARTAGAFKLDLKMAVARVPRIVEKVKGNYLGDATKLIGGSDAAAIVRELHATEFGLNASAKLSETTAQLVSTARKEGWVTAFRRHTALRGGQLDDAVTEVRRLEQAARKKFPEEGYAEPAMGVLGDQRTAASGLRVLNELDARKTYTYKVIGGKYAGQTGTLVKETKSSYVLEVDAPQATGIVRQQRAIAKDKVAVITDAETVAIMGGKYAGKSGRLVSETPKTMLLEIDGSQVRVAKNRIMPTSVDSPTRSIETGVNWAPPAMPPIEAMRDVYVSNGVSKYVRTVQKESHSIVNTEAYAMEELARRWSAEDGAPADIFPDRQYGGLRGTSEMGLATTISLRGIKNPTLRKFLTHWSSKFRRGMLDAVDFDSATAPDVIETMARIVSDDQLFADEMVNRWVRTKSDRGKKYVAEAIVKKANERFDLERSTWKFASKKADESYFESIMPQAETGEAVGSLKGKKNMLPDTSYAQYKAAFEKAGKAGSTAPYNLKATDLSWFERASHRWVDNKYRGWTRTVKPVAGFMRQWAVAMGPQLFFKHGLTDTGRTIIENGPGALVFAARANRVFEQALQEIKAETFATVMKRHVKAEMSEQHYNMANGNLPLGYRAGHIYDAEGKATRQSMKAGTAALRRITQGERFALYATRGEEQLRAWLHSKEGVRWLYESNTVDGYKQAAGKDAATGRKLIDEAAEQYIETWVKGYWEPLQMNAPRIYEGLTNIVREGRNPTARELEAIVRDVNKNGVAQGENPFLSMEVHDALTFGNLPGRATGLWMTTNKWNRRILFRDTFANVYEDLKRQGADADSAARVASTVADMNTARVHFDLSNAMLIEQQNRWFAWFATKHRLYGTYLLKMAVERPQIAGAAIEVANWLEDANEDLGEDSYDKYTIRFNVAGHTFRIPVAPLFWLTDYPLESNMGRGLVAAGAYAVGAVSGREMHSGPGSFGWQLTPFDDEIRTVAIYLPLWTKMRSGGELTDAEVTEWLDGIKRSKFGGVDAYEQTCKAVSMARAIAKHQGQEISIGEAVSRAMWSNFAYEMQQAVRMPVKVDVHGAAKGEMEKLFDEYISLKPDARSKFGEEHPEVLMMMGLKGFEPVQKAEIDRGWEDLQRLRTEEANALWSAFELNENADLQRIRDHYAVERSKIFDPNFMDENGQPSELRNDVFAEYYDTMGGEAGSVAEDLMGIWPLKGLKAMQSLAATGYVPNTDQYDKERARLQANFEGYIADIGGLSKTNVLYSYYHDIMVDEPLAKYGKDDPNRWTTYAEMSTAEAIARGEGGQVGADAYLLEKEKQHKLDTFKKGIAGNAKDGTTYPMFMAMNANERKLTGWVGTPESNQQWAIYRIAYVTTKRYMAENEISSNSKQGIAMLAQVSSLGDAFAKQNDTFNKEWTFSNMPLHERLIELGVGSGTSDREQGWATFLDIVSDYQDELKTVDNPSRKEPGVGPTSATANPISKKYLSMVVKLARDNEEWKYSFMSGFSLSNFGFYDKLTDGSDHGLWKEENLDVEYYE